MCNSPPKLLHMDWFVTMYSITKSIPVFNAKTRIISYAWEDLVNECPSCPRCGNRMCYWYSRKRGIIISEQKLIFMAPRFKCTCGRTMTMRPYFIVERKQYSAFSIQEILNAYTSGDKSVATSYGNSMVTGLLKWAAGFLKNLGPARCRTDNPDANRIINTVRSRNGDLWLSSLLRRLSGSVPFHIPLYSGIY